jgi:hypothetical protein
MRPPTVCNYINSTLCHPPFSLAEGGANTSHCDKTPVCGIGKAEFTDFFLGGCDALWIELLLYPGDKPLEEKEISNQREKKEAREAGSNLRDLAVLPPSLRARYRKWQ